MLAKIRKFFEDNYPSIIIRAVTVRRGKDFFIENNVLVRKKTLFYDTDFEYWNKTYYMTFREDDNIEAKFNKILEELQLVIPS